MNAIPSIQSFEEFEAATISLLTPPFSSKYGAVLWRDLDAPGLELDFLIDGWFTRGERSIIGGPSRSGKSFLAIHTAMCVCLGTPFFEREVRRGAVAYQAGEGARGVKRRLKAYREHFGIPKDADVPFVFLGSKVDLWNKDGDTKPLIEEIKEWGRRFNWPLELVVIDTLATASVGANENDGKDMGIVLSNIARIAEETGAHVMLVHHMNADGKKLRGHTSIFGNVDQVITVTLDETTKIRTAILAKQKDDEDGLRLNFTLKQVKLGFDKRTDRDITSCVVLTVDEKERLAKEEARLGYGPNLTERKIIDTLFKAMDRHGKYITGGVKEEPYAALGKTAVKWETYLNVALEHMLEIEDRKKAADAVRREWKRVYPALVKFGIIGLDSPWMWWAGKPVRGFRRTYPDGRDPNQISNEQQPLSPGMQDTLDYGETIF